MDVNEFIAFEESFALFDMQINGLKIWKFIRFNFFEKVNGISISSEKPTRSNTRYLRILISYISHFLKHRQKVRTKKTALVLLHPRKIKIKNIYEDIYMSSIIKIFGNDCSIIDLPQEYYEKMTYFELPYNNIIHADKLRIRVLLKALIYKVFLHERRIKRRPDFNSLTSILYRETRSSNISKQEIESLVYFAYIKKKPYEVYYRGLLSRIKPRLVFGVISYSFDSICLNEQANLLGIPTVEMQHGTILSNHLGYNYPDRKFEFLPKHILLFGQYWNSKVNFKSNTTTHVVGWPYFERRFEQINQNKQPMNEIILIISQFQVGKLFSRIAIELSQNQQLDHMKIVYKLHSEEFANWKDLYPDLDNSGVEVIDNNDNDVHHYLSKASFLIVGKSTVLFESLVYNPKIFIFSNNDEEMDELIERKIGIGFCNSKDILEQLNCFSNTTNLSNEFWERNSQNNVESVVREILISR